MNTFLSSCDNELVVDCKKFVEEKLSSLIDGARDDNAKVKQIFELTGQNGYLGSIVPKEYGGAGEPFFNFILFTEVLAAKDAGICLALASHIATLELVAKYGTDKQKSRYLPLLARGECIGSIAFSEEFAGSDYENINCELVEKDSKFLLNGKKTWVVNGEIANLAIVSARLKSASDNQDKLSLVLVDLNENKSIKVSKNRSKLGLESARTNDIEFKDLEVGADCVLSISDLKNIDKELGFKEASLYAMDVSKTIVAASGIGLINRALELSVNHANAREQFGTAIGKLQAIQWKLADMSADSQAARLLTYRAAWSKDEEPSEFKKNAAMCKYYAAKIARVHSAEAVQIFGAMGVSTDEPIEKMYRDAKVMEIAEGTSEIQKNLIAREIGS